MENHLVSSAAGLWFETDRSLKAYRVKCSFGVLMKGASSVWDAAVWLLVQISKILPSCQGFIVFISKVHFVHCLGDSLS